MGPKIGSYRSEGACPWCSPTAFGEGLLGGGGGG